MKTLEIQIGANENCTFDIKTFNIVAGIISASYKHHLSLIDNQLKQISIDLYYREIPLELTEFKTQGGKYAIIVSRWIDWDTHFSLSEKAQKQQILDTLHDSCLLMCDKYGFDKQPFETAYQNVIETNFTHKVLFNKPTLSKNRRHRAAIQIDMQTDGARINVLFCDKTDMEIARREVIRLKPNYYFINQLIHKGKWLDNERYMVSDRNEVVRFIVALNSDDVEMALCSQTMSRNEVLQKLETLKA